MASKTNRQNGGGVWKGSSSQVKTPPHFFKIIHSAVVPHQKLRIPKKFMNQYGMNLGNHVFLKVPSGTVWEVELEKSDGEVWMSSGWKEFAKYYSMGFGHLLVFKYDGNCNFDVLIFDKSASEIEYPVSATRGEQTNANINGTFKIPKTEDIIEVDDSVETLGDIPCARYNTKRKETYGRGEFEKLGIQSRQKTRKIYHDKENLEKDDSVEILDDSLGRDFTASEKGRGNAKFGMQNNPSMLEFPPDIHQYSEGLKLPNQKKDVETRNEAEGYPVDKSSEERRHQSQIPVKIPSAISQNMNSSALERARDFKSKKPFFMVHMTPSYVSGRSNLNVPKKFTRKYLKDCQKNISLGISDGTTLLLRFYPRACGRREIHWRPFARDNNLKAGDVCVFELISMGIEPQLDVTIFPK